MKAKKFISYRGHVIWYDGYEFKVALNKNKTDRYFNSLREAMEAINAFEDSRKQHR